MPNADRLVDDSAVKPDVDEVRVLLTQDALMLKGWKSVRISRSVEVATSEFQMTCSADANTLKLLGKEGAPVTVSIGDSLVLTGFVETIETYLTPKMH
ncbi:phage baseplate assembly protein, partial [Paraburkholderia tropica]|uniref:phage baseplate assembly protein n=1 Tax=Paraburkholderia tropica TaxID=92647 RepID=UPI0009F7076F